MKHIEIKVKFNKGKKKDEWPQDDIIFVNIYIMPPGSAAAAAAAVVSMVTRY